MHKKDDLKNLKTELNLIAKKYINHKNKTSKDNLNSRNKKRGIKISLLVISNLLIIFGVVLGLLLILLRNMGIR